MFDVLSFLYEFLSSKYLLFAVMFLSSLCKSLMLIMCIRYNISAPLHRVLLILLTLYLAGSLLSDICHMSGVFIRGILHITDDLPNRTLLIRLSWCFYITQYQAIAVFFEQLTEKKVKFGWFHALHALINIAVSSQFLYLAIFKYNVPSGSPDTLSFEIALINYISLYLPFLFIPTFYKVFRRSSISGPPRILTYQLRYLTRFFVPYLLVEFVNNSDLVATMFPLIQAHKYSLFTLTTLFSTYTLYFVGRRMMGLALS